MSVQWSESEHPLQLPVICFSTAPSLEVAQQLANALIERQLAACVSFLPGATSVYRWKDEICHDAEVWIMIKTTPQAYAALQAAWNDLHPYEVPELLAVSVGAGLPAYVDWVFASVVPLVSGGASAPLRTQQGDRSNTGSNPFEDVPGGGA